MTGGPIRLVIIAAFAVVGVIVLTQAFPSVSPAATPPPATAGSAVVALAFLLAPPVPLPIFIAIEFDVAFQV